MANEQEFFAALKGGDVDKVRALLAAHPDLANARDDKGMSAVLVARYHGRVEVIPALLEAGAKLTLWEAAVTGQTDRLRALLKSDPSLAHAYSEDGFAPLHSGYFAPPEVLEILLQHGADPNTQSKNAMALRPLHSAASTGNPKNVEMLLKAGADPNARQHGGWAPIHAAAQSGNEAVARLLLDCGAEPNPANDAGQTAVGLAREKGHSALAELLESAAKKRASA